MLLPPSNPSVHHKKQQCLKQLRDISKSLSNGFQLRFWIRCSSTTCFFSVPTSSSSCFHIRSPKLRSCTAECAGFWCPRYGRRSRFRHSRHRPIWSTRGIRLRSSCPRERFRCSCPTRWFGGHGICGASGRFRRSSSCHRLCHPGLRVWSRTCTQCIRGTFIQWRTNIWRIRWHRIWRWCSSCFFQRRRHGWLSKSNVWCSTRFFKTSWR